MPSGMCPDGVCKGEVGELNESFTRFVCMRDSPSAFT